MPNPYHDAEGKFASRDEMAHAIDQSMLSGDMDTALRLKKEMEDIDSQKAKNSDKAESVFYTGATVVHNRNRYAIAEEGRSGTICMRCRYNLSPEESEEAIHGKGRRCPNCGTPNTGDVFLAAVVKDHAKFFDAEEVRNAVWYHATTTPDWHQAMLELDDRELLKDEITEGEDITPLVHLGSYETALDRANDISKNNEGEGPWYIHEIRLKPDTEVNDTIMPDENDEAPEYAAFAVESGYSANGVTRYVNGFECAGHMSLVANVKSFEIIGTRVLEPAL